MSLDTLAVDAYQLTTLIAHAASGRLEQRVAMALFFRKLPKRRNYVVFAGLRAIVEQAAAIRVAAEEVEALSRHEVLGPALARYPEVRRALLALDGFRGDIDALPEGTLAFAGPARRSDGKPFTIAGSPLAIYTPLLQVRTDMVLAKLIETPWLSRVNHLSMVASKAARVVDAAAGKPVLEFGQRRTHPAAAVEASYAACLAGCAGTSNVAAYLRYGLPLAGTMDHFAVQAAERAEVPVEETEAAFFADFARLFPTAATLLVDTYATERGIRQAVQATAGKLTGIRIDSDVTATTITRARRLLDELGAGAAKIFVSDGMDEGRVQEVAHLADGFGVGENITCSPDAATGVGAVAKLTVNGYGKLTMKLARGSGKATLPGELQVHRYPDHDLVALADEAAPAGGRPLLQPLWRDRGLVAELPAFDATRAFVRAQIEALPPRLRALEVAAEPWPLVASDGLAALVERLVREAGG